MIKKRMNKLLVIIYIIMLICMISNIVSAFSEPIKTVDLKGAEGRIAAPINEIIGILQILGVSIAVIILMALGVKFMAASPSERASIKTHATTYLIGATLFFGFSGILTLIKLFAGELTAIK